MDSTKQTPKSQLFFNEEFNLIIRDRQTVLYSGTAASVTTKNDGGLMDIIPEHTNFISIIKEFIRYARLDGTKKEIPISTGVVKVEKNDVRIYLGIYTTAK